MKILKYPKIFLTYVGFYNDESTALFERIIGVILNVYSVLCLISCVLLGFMFFYKDDKYDAEEIMNVEYESTISVSTVVANFVLLLKRKEIISLIKKFQKDVNQYITPKTTEFYKNAEKYTEYTSKSALIFSIIVYAILYVVYMVSMLIYELNRGEVNVEGWFTIYKLW